ncbi:MAG: hypothetical protein JO183_06430 [Ktedonobacteraceae bacterium]|nr:hypothetical protein [Ktedonobacteraceae bacterium]
MAKKPPMRVALDLETTGLHAEQDTILEVAAVKFQGSDIIDTFETFVAPGRAIPYRVQRLTGIKPEHLVGAPPFAAIAEKLQRFLGNLPLVGHSIPFDVNFLLRRGLARTNQLIDTFELAIILLPSLASYNLGHVSTSLGIPVPPDRHRAMVDTLLAMHVFLQLHERLQAVDIALLREVANLDAARTWPLLSFFKQELHERQAQDGLRGPLVRGSLGDQLAAQLAIDPRVLSFAMARREEVSPPPVVSQASLPSLQSLEQRVEVLPERDEAPQRFQAARRAVREAFEQKTPLLMEVTVGANDATPALLPALEWLCDAATLGERRLVIACSSPQYARRLTEIILPRLQETLKCHFPVAYLSEDGGYLCTHRWFGAALHRRGGELTAEEARGLAKLGIWAQQTMAGERSELTLLTHEMAAWQRVASASERLPLMDKRTVHEHCAYRRKGYCFVNLAEERVKTATIVVTTHTGLFDDLSSPHSLLKGIDQRLILDTDLLESEENAPWRGTELDHLRLIRLLNTLGTEPTSNRYQGLLALAAPSLRENGPGGLSRTPTIAKAELDTRMLVWFQLLRQACAAVEKLFNCFSQLLEEFLQQGFSGNGRDKARAEVLNHQGSVRNAERPDPPLRLSVAVRSLGTWIDTERAWQQVAQRLQAVIDLAHDAEKMLLASQHGRHQLANANGENALLAAELATVARQLTQQRQLGQQALSLNESEMVYWLRLPFSVSQQNPQHYTASSSSPMETSPVLYAQLVQVSSLLKRLHVAENTGTIFVGAALSVDSSFSFYRGRLGLADTCSALSVVTERYEQTLLYMPNDVPEPNMAQYQRYLDDALIQLASTLDGQLVALFTSHAALRSCYGSIKPVLETRGILVLGQGVDGSPRQLWQVFQSQEQVVLLVTAGFWESVDDVQRSPTCLFIARLPMPALNDPLMAARAEHYGSDQLHQFTVPLAALRTRRVLNRSVWSDTRRNCIVLFDRRVLSKDYGSVILHSLPHCSQRQAAVSHMPETIMDWLTGTGAWE